MVKGKILPQWVLFGEGISGPSLEDVLKKFEDIVLDQECEQLVLEEIPYKGMSGGTKERIMSKKKDIKSSIRGEIEELCRIATSINQEPQYPKEVYKVGEGNIPQVDVFEYIEKERYSKARTFLDKYKRHFLQSKFLKKSDQKQFLGILEKIVSGRYDKEVIQSLKDEEFIKKKKEPRVQVYVMPSFVVKKYPDFEKALLKIKGYNEGYRIYLDIIIIPYIMEKGKEEIKEKKAK